MKRTWLLLIVVLALAVATVRSVVFVDETEFAIITQFGRPIGTHRDAGLHVKRPWQSAIRIDRRLQIYDPKPAEFLASEKKTVNLDVYACWYVEAPQRFLETVVNFAGAEERIHDIVWSALRNEVGRHPLEALVSTDPGHKLDQLMADLTVACDARARQAYGLRIVDVRLKRIAVPKQVRDSVFQRMRAERARIARKYRAEGDKEALGIRAQADKTKTVILAQAYAEAEKTRGAAEAEATRIYADAHGKDPKLFELLRTLEAYRKFLDDKTTILLSSDSDLLKYLTRGSMLDEEPKKKQP